MKTKFDKIYVLSLITEHTRRKFIESQFNNLGIEFEFLYGTDFYNLNCDARNNKINYPNVWEPGWFDDKPDKSKDYGCTLSHYNAILFAYELGYNNVLVIEDDVCFIKDTKLIFECFNNIPNDADYVTWDPRFVNLEDYKLYKSFIEDKTLYTDITGKLTDHLMAGGLMYGIMNRKTMKEYLNNQRASLKMSDQVNGFNSNNKNIKKYVCNKCICTELISLLINFEYDKNNWHFAHRNIYSFDNKLDKTMFYDPDFENNKYEIFTH